MLPSTVIKGLIKNKELVIHSTHLYEIVKNYNNTPTSHSGILKTTVDDQLEFSYIPKNGISNDRLGYLILKREVLWWKCWKNCSGMAYLPVKSIRMKSYWHFVL